MAVLGHTPFQFMQTRAQLLHLLPELLVLCSELLILFLQAVDQFFLTHDSILIVQVKGALYSHAVFGQVCHTLQRGRTAPRVIGSGGALFSSTTLGQIVADTLGVPVYPSLDHEASA